MGFRASDEKGTLHEWEGRAERGLSGTKGAGERDATAKVATVVQLMPPGTVLPAGRGSDTWFEIWIDLGQGGMGVLRVDFDMMMVFWTPAGPDCVAIEVRAVFTIARGRCDACARAVLVCIGGVMGECRGYSH